MKLFCTDKIFWRVSINCTDNSKNQEIKNISSYYLWQTLKYA